MSDVYCAKCGEPWDRAELGGNGALSDDEAKLFRAGDGCPSCRWGAGRKTVCCICNGFGKRANYPASVWKACEHCNGTGEEPPQSPKWREFWAAVTRGERPPLPNAAL